MRPVRRGPLASGGDCSFDRALGLSLGTPIRLADSLATLPVTEIWAQYSTDNDAAAALFRKLGFQVMRQEAVAGHATQVRKQTWSLYSSGDRASSQGMSSIVMSDPSPAKKGD